MNGENLRETLRRHAADAPPGSGLLDAVKARSRDRRRHRRLAVAGAAAVAVAVAVTAPTAVRGIGDGPDRPAPPPAGQQTPVTPEVEPTGATTLVPAPEFGLPDFPFTPTWVPPDLTQVSYQYSFSEFGDAPDYLGTTLSHRGSGAAELYVTLDNEDTEQTLSRLETEAEIGYEDEDEPTAQTPQPLTRQAANVQGRDATLLSNADQGVVSWQHAPDLWVTIFAQSADEALRYANGLAEEPFEAQTPFTFDLVPDGAELSYTATDTMSFGPSDGRSGSSDDVVAVQLIRVPRDRESPGYCPVFYEDDDRTELTGTDVCPLSRTPVQLGEHAGELVGDRTVNVFLPDGLILQVSAGGALSLSRDDMLRFVEGIEVTEFAIPPT